MKTTIKDNVLHIEIPLHAPRPSATGKTLTVASSNGNPPTEARVNGLPVIAYIKPKCLEHLGRTSSAVGRTIPTCPTSLTFPTKSA